VVTLSWNGEAASEELLELELYAKTNARLSEVLSLGSRYTAAEAYERQGGLLDLALVFVDDPVPGAAELYQNTPNPFETATAIGFTLPEKSNVTVTLTDLTGRSIRVAAGEFAAGYHEVVVDRHLLPSAGVWYYTLATATFTASKKMILLDSN
jgi:hypothetical protein